YAQMASDANAISLLANNPNATTQDLITAAQIALKYSDYMNQSWDFAGWLKGLQANLQNGGSPDWTGAFALVQAAGDMAIMAQSQDAVLGEQFIDPDIATGYEYTSTVNFRSVLIPKPLPGGQTMFELVVGDRTFPLEAKKRFWFGKDGGFAD